MKFEIRNIVPVKADWDDRILTFDEGRSEYYWDPEDDERVRGWVQHGIVGAEDRKKAQIALLSGQAVPGFLQRRGESGPEAEDDPSSMVQSFVRNVNPGAGLTHSISGERPAGLPEFDELERMADSQDRDLLDREGKTFPDEIAALVSDVSRGLSKLKDKIFSWHKKVHDTDGEPQQKE